MKEHLKKHKMKEQHKKKEYYMVANADKGYLACKCGNTATTQKTKARKFYSSDEAETAAVNANKLFNVKFIAIHSTSEEAKVLEKIFSE